MDAPTGPVMSRIDGGVRPAVPAVASEAVVAVSQPRSSSIFFLCTARSALQSERAAKSEEIAE